MKILIITSGGGDYSATHVQQAFEGQVVADVIPLLDDGGDAFNDGHPDDDVAIQAEVRTLDIVGDVEALMEIIRSTFNNDHCGIWAENEIF